MMTTQTEITVTETVTETKPIISLDNLKVVATVTAPYEGNRFEGLEECDWYSEVEEE